MRSSKLNLIVTTLILIWTGPGCMWGDDKGESLSPEEFIATAGLSDGLRLELAASEPAVVDPVGVTFDANGRMYVVEMGDYPTRPEGSPPQGRIKQLIDKDLDGYYETWTVFADGLQYPTSVLPWRNGILVIQPPDILWLQDKNNDGEAENQEVLFSGFPVGNTQHNINGLIWGLDNWIYAANGGNHGSGHAVNTPDASVSIRGMDFRFRPDTGELETSYQTTGGHGIAFDAWGRMFGTHNLDHVQHMVFRTSYLERNPWLAVPTTRDMISDHGNSATLFQLSDAETRVNHPEQSGRFSGGSGIAFYTGGALPALYENSLFVNDCVVNVVHQDVVTTNGPSFTASRRAEGVELLAGRDNWFRPVTITTGPEGALYVVDMHRAVIEHPEWIPDAVEANLDIWAGNDKGRIYRIVPESGLPKTRPELTSANISTLVDSLTHANKWWRDTAQRLLIERTDLTAVPLLRNMLSSSDIALGRLHALWTLHGLGALSVDDIKSGLRDKEPGVRENALVLSETYLKNSHSLLNAVVETADDQDARVRMQAALSLGSAASPEAHEGLLKILSRDAEHQWTRYAILASLGENGGNSLGSLLQMGDLQTDTPKRISGLLEAIRHLGTSAVISKTENVTTLIKLAEQKGLNNPWRAALLDGLADGIERSETPPTHTKALSSVLSRLLSSTDTPVSRAALRIASITGTTDLKELDRVLERARSRALDHNLTAEKRTEEIALLGLSTYSRIGPALLQLMKPQSPPVLQVAAARALANLNDKERGIATLNRWHRYGADVKAIVLDMLLRNQPFHELIINALENGDISVGELNLDLEQRRRLLRRSSEDIQKRASALFGDHEFSNRQEVVDQWLPRVINQNGDVDQGGEHFQKLCAQCHLFRGEGYPVGPDLGMAFSKGQEDLLTSILDPSSAFAPEYANYFIETIDGKLLNGIVTTETVSSVTLARANGETDIVLRSQIKNIRAEGRSLMPDGLEQGLDANGLADLLAYLRQHNH